jgi:sigma-54 dependent transcriptional regulator, acetoin dehydrogenase operon transcriptional activator AcoR
MAAKGVAAPVASAVAGADRERPDLVAQWHERARALGLRESDTPDFCSVGRSELSQAVETNRRLYLQAVPVLETLYEQIRNTHSMVILTDQHGLIMHTLGDNDFLERANRVALSNGVVWSEDRKGTNAIGTALSEERPTVVQGQEHYLHVNRFLTCSCAPILDTCGKSIGALDVSGDWRSYHPHTMALVRMAAQMIENQLFADNLPRAIRIHFHSRPEFLGTLVQGIIAFSPAGQFLAANRGALYQLGYSRNELQAHSITSLFGIPVSTVFDHYQRANPGPLRLRMHNGVEVHAVAHLHVPAPMFRPAQIALEREETRRPEAPASSPAWRHRTLDTLDTGDPLVARALTKVRQVQGHEIPIMILGETGTGKEWLAQAIHNESARRANPFVAVNCASIPESLIETELFGYEEGAFTGARKKGNIGKMQLANGGTLFLDEIGDMPLNLQARLLRVLQDRMVTPLGSVKSIAVNIAVICATSRNLQMMIAQGEFRHDLYYRLCGQVVKLPPLRARSDIEAIVVCILSRDGDPESPREVSPEVMALFKGAPWPGNLRQLTNVLLTARAVAHGEPSIRIEHLPDDFVDEVVAAAVEVAVPSPAAGATTSIMASGATAALGACASLGELQASAIALALKQHNGNVSAAARALNVSRNTIYRWLSTRDKKTA